MKLAMPLLNFASLNINKPQMAKTDSNIPKINTNTIDSAAIMANYNKCGAVNFKGKNEEEEKQEAKHLKNLKNWYGKNEARKALQELKAQCAQICKRRDNPPPNLEAHVWLNHRNWEDANSNCKILGGAHDLTVKSKIEGTWANKHFGTDFNSLTYEKVGKEIATWENKPARDYALLMLAFNNKFTKEDMESFTKEISNDTVKKEITDVLGPVIRKSKYCLNK